MTNNRMVVAILISWALLIPGVVFSPLLYLFDFINALGFTLGAAVLYRYLPGAFWAILCALKGKPIGRGAMLVLGIAQTWLAMIVRTSAIWNWRWHGEPDGGLDSLPMTIAAYLIIGGGICHLAASTMREDYIERPHLSARLIGGSLAAGFLLGAVIAYTRWYIAVA